VKGIQSTSDLAYDEQQPKKDEMKIDRFGR